MSVAYASILLPTTKGSQMEIYNGGELINFSNEEYFEGIIFAEENDGEEAYFESLWLEQQDEEWVDSDLFFENEWNDAKWGV